MIRECELCGERLADQEREEVCLSCQEDTFFDCSRCGALMEWQDREHTLCQDCRDMDFE